MLDPWFENDEMDAGFDFGFQGSTLAFVQGRGRAVAYDRYLEKRHAVRPGYHLAHYLSSHDVPTALYQLRGDVRRFRLPVWVAAPSPDLLVCRRLLLSYGVEPIHLADRQADWSAFARDWVKKNGAAGHLAILVTGPSEQDPGANSRMELLELEAS